MKPLLILFILCTGVVAQSRDDLRKKYGEPVSETFLLGSGITVTASHNSNGQITELLIAPFATGLIKSKGNGLSLTREKLEDVIDELVPLSARGTPTFAGFLNVGCLPENDCYGSFSSYEKLTIYYNAGKNRNVNYVVIQWKR